ncbi:MAG TPA: CGNR zinc finger domain-containing protein [Mycobacteriales bacterium]|nr:CGNR zinc finger domain-containing protein [Mycobacteriales bacterium]
MDAAPSRAGQTGRDPFQDVRCAPAPLDLPQSLLNTRSLLRSFDDLQDLPAARRWIASSAPARRAGLVPEDLDEEELPALRVLREAVRELLLSAEAPEPGDRASQGVVAAAAGVPLVLGVDPGGTPLVRPHPDAPRVRGAVLAAVAMTPADAWRRLTICRNPACRWAFYDTSRNRAGTWCDMNICGARAKMRRYRGTRA